MDSNQRPPSQKSDAELAAGAAALIAGTADPKLIADGIDALSARYLRTIEIKSAALAESFSHLTGSLRSNLHAASAITLQHLSLHSDCASSLEETTKTALGGMQTFMVRVDELDDELERLYSLQEEIREVKKALDLLETVYSKFTASQAR